LSYANHFSIIILSGENEDILGIFNGWDFTEWKAKLTVIFMEEVLG